jgi:hypothetical protein
MYNPQLVQQMGLQSTIQPPASPSDFSTGLAVLSDRFAANSNNSDAVFPIEQSNPYDAHGSTAPRADTNLDRGRAGMMTAMSLGMGMGDQMGGQPVQMSPQRSFEGSIPSMQETAAQAYIQRMQQKAARSNQMQAQAAQTPSGATGAY